MRRSDIKHANGGGDWDGTSITRMGDAKGLAGPLTERTGNHCPDCGTELVRNSGDHSGFQFCVEQCNARWLVR